MTWSKFKHGICEKNTMWQQSWPPHTVFSPLGGHLVVHIFLKKWKWIELKFNGHKVVHNLFKKWQWVELEPIGHLT
jgi:hypothetical protein